MSKVTTPGHQVDQRVVFSSPRVTDQNFRAKYYQVGGEISEIAHCGDRADVDAAGDGWRRNVQKQVVRRPDCP